MDEDVFKFKKFEAYHGRSSMKIGVDAVLIGSWAGEKASKILDVGTGCGVIALIMAQRFPEARVDAIDIDSSSIEEANKNFFNSIWRENMKACLEVFPDETMMRQEKYDLIVSNPPFFNSGVTNPATPREKARHQTALSVFSLLKYSGNILTDKGSLAVIFPSMDSEEVVAYSSEYGWKLKKTCFIRNKISLPEKRVMMEFTKDATTDFQDTEQLTLFECGEPTDQYRALCKNLYIKF